MDTDVCVIGAGFAGLTAARRLVQAGRDVVVLEARGRVGGRVWTEPGPSGVPLDLGGTFVGPMHDRIHALIAEVGASTHPTFVAGDSVLATGGTIKRYRGDVPRISPVALVAAGAAIRRLDAMAKAVPVEAPWDARRADRWDGQTVATWLARVPSREGRELLATTVRALFCCSEAEVSLLDLLFLIRSAGGLTPLMTVEGGYQHEQVVGGMQTVVDAMAADLGVALVLDSPVQSIATSGGGYEVVAARGTVRSRRVVVALPPALAGHIRFEPALPGDRALLLHTLPAGTEIKCVAVYDEPFWRADGVSGASAATDALIEVTLDTSPPDGSAGVLAGYCAGPKARQLAAMAPDDRRRVFVDTLVTRFGPKAATPVAHRDVTWWDEEWTRGCSMAHFPPGILTGYGRLLREPLGGIHWAGTETASVSHGAIDGAVRSGERVAREILSEAGASRSSR